MTSSNSSIDVQIASLDAMPRADLVERWKKKYKHPPPKGVKRRLLERAIAYQLQSRKFGRLKSETSKKLLAIATGANSSLDHKTTQTGSHQGTLKPGSHLVREWHGKPYQVMVTDKGFEWDGEEYTSLSAIAKAITGAKWSGPRFFGL